MHAKAIGLLSAQLSLGHLIPSPHILSTCAYWFQLIMLANLFNKNISSSPIESPSQFQTSPLSLNGNIDVESLNSKKVNNVALFGAKDVMSFKFDKSDFRILVLQDTGNILSTDRYFVLYDSDSERLRDRNRTNKAINMTTRVRHEPVCDPKEVRKIAQYLFGSSFQGETKQTSRIHCEPQDLGNDLKNKTLAVRTYHFDANFEESLLEMKRRASATSANDPVPSYKVPSKYSSTPEFRTDVFSPADKSLSWNIEPSTKIEYDFSSKNNTPIGICIILPFTSHVLGETLGANHQEFEKWLYELQDLTLKYLKKYYSLQVENKNITKFKPRYFKVDHFARNKIHFNKFILQSNFESEKVFQNYYLRINIFLNTPRIISGIINLEKILQVTDNQLKSQLCKEIRHWLTIHESQNKSLSSRFLATVLALIHPIRHQLVENRPADRKKQVIRVVFSAQNDVVINSLLFIISCFLPDVVFKYSVLEEQEFTHLQQFKKRHGEAMSSDSAKEFGKTSDSSFVDKDTSFDKDLSLETTFPQPRKPELHIEPSHVSHSRSSSIVKPGTPSYTPISPLLSKTRGLALSSPKSIPMTLTNTFDCLSVYSSSDASSLKSFADYDFPVRSGSISSGRMNSRSSSFIGEDAKDTRKKLIKTFSVADLTLKSIRSRRTKALELMKRSSTSINKINIKPRVSEFSHRVVAVENKHGTRNYIKNVMFNCKFTTLYDAATKGLEVKGDVDFDDYDSAFDYTADPEESPYVNNDYSRLEDRYGKIVIPSVPIRLPPLVGVSPDFIPEFTIQAVRKDDNLKSLIFTAMKQDLFHNLYIDKCVKSNLEESYTISRTLYINSTTREINDFEILLKPFDHDVPSIVDIPATLHGRNSSVFSISSSGSPASSYSGSPSVTASSLLGIFDFNSSHLTNNNPFAFEGNDFVLMGNRVVDSLGKLYCKNMSSGISEMEAALNGLANLHDIEE